MIGYSGNFCHDLTKPVGMKQKIVDIKNLEKFGWSAKTSLTDGIKNAYKFFIGEM